MITDREKVIAAAGCSKKILEGESISSSLEKILDDRNERLPVADRAKMIPVTDDMDTENEQIFCPIRSGGEILGALFLISRDTRKKMGDMERKLAAVAADFLGRQANM